MSDALKTHKNGLKSKIMDNNDNARIVERFFMALDTLKKEGVIHSRSAFYSRYGIPRRNAETLRQEPHRHILRPCWLAYLVKDYGIDPLWLLTGAGDMGEKWQKCEKNVRKKESENVSI